MNVRQLAARVDPGGDVRQRGSPAAPAREAPGSSFAEQLRRANEGLSAPSDLRLSAHAQQRIEQRGISLDAAQQRHLSEAMQQLEAKGSQDALLLRSDAAFVVNVPSRTVVTAVSTGEMQERIFTQIDSAMVV